MADVSRSTVQNIEAGRVGRAHRLRDIAEALDTTVEELTGQESQPASDDTWETLRQIGAIDPNSLDPDTLDRVADTVTQLAREIRRLRGQSGQAAG